LSWRWRIARLFATRDRRSPQQLHLHSGSSVGQQQASRRHYQDNHHLDTVRPMVARVAEAAIVIPRKPWIS
jgi:hypothetical protein